MSAPLEALAQRLRRTIPAFVAVVIFNALVWLDTPQYRDYPVGWVVSFFTVVVTGVTGVLTGLAAGLWARQRPVLDGVLSVVLGLVLTLAVSFILYGVHAVGCGLGDDVTVCYPPPSDRIFAFLGIETVVLFHALTAWFVDLIRSPRSSAAELPA